MSVGFVMLVHQSLGRAAEVASYWARHECPVVIHVDSRTDHSDYEKLQQDLSSFDNVEFSPRKACDWGQFSIVEATQLAAAQLLNRFSQVSHVFLASGSCLPLVPARDLQAFLDDNKRVDFIESATTEEVKWTVGGLDLERFTFRFPFSWRKNRWLFDRYVGLQRRLGYSRRIPKGIVPHLGSQWWCLTRQTLSQILEDPQRAVYDRYFSKVWIPDEAYFQSLVRKYSTAIESRSLTLSKFDNQGKPHIFYDDHMQLLRRSDCYVVRKIWPEANGLYERFLSDEKPTSGLVEPNPRKLDRIFARARQQRTHGRDGLIMQSRFPRGEIWGLSRTCAPYSVYEGFSDIFTNFETWLEKRTGTRVHGHLFHKDEVKFSGGVKIYNGCLSNSAKMRDYNAVDFLANLIWNTQGEHQSFQFGPDDRQHITQFLASDPNARISIVTGAWAVPLFHSNLNFSKIRKLAAKFQRVEVAHLEALKAHSVRARVQMWSLSDFVENPMPILQSIIDAQVSGASRRLSEVPHIADLQGFGKFVQNLRNQGMNPHLVGDFPISDVAGQQDTPPRPYLVR